jgi:SOS-response transcriptional repressor LexA
MEGDLVIIEKEQVPKMGKIVIAQVDRKWTLKYFEKRGGHPGEKGAGFSAVAACA